MLDSTRPIRLKSGAMTFEEPSDVYGVESDDDWAALVHRGIGFLYPQASETMHIGANISVYGVSAFHQLHCVDMLRKFYNYAKRGELAAYAAQEMHMLHCFNYLRQGILCAADTTLEPDYWKIEGPGKISPLPRNSSKGVGSKHRCRDASPLWKATIQSNTLLARNYSRLLPRHNLQIAIRTRFLYFCIPYNQDKTRRIYTLNLCLYNHTRNVSWVMACVFVSQQIFKLHVQLPFRKLPEMADGETNIANLG